MNEVIACPWGALPVNLAGMELEANEKMWFANQINDFGRSSPELARLYNLNERVIRRYAQRLREGKPFHTGHCRPRIIDRYGITSVVENCHNDLALDNVATNQYLVIASQETMKRRYPQTLDEELPTNLKKRTRSRYIGIVSKLMNEDEDTEAILLKFH